MDAGTFEKFFGIRVNPIGFVIIDDCDSGLNQSFGAV